MFVIHRRPNFLVLACFKAPAFSIVRDHFFQILCSFFFKTFQMYQGELKVSEKKKNILTCSRYIGQNLRQMVDRPDGIFLFRLHKAILWEDASGPNYPLCILYLYNYITIYFFLIYTCIYRYGELVLTS